MNPTELERERQVVTKEWTEKVSTRLCVPYIEKRWLGERSAAFREAQKQAAEFAREQGSDTAEFTGRTFHSPNDWAFEFRYEVGA